MKTKHKDKIKTLSLIEAVETLSDIADLKPNQETETYPLLSVERKIHWLKDSDTDMSLNVVKEIFKVILSHLKATWETQVHLVTPDKIESIKTIMILVGEAAKKLDRYTELFNETKEKSVTDLKEYIELKKFYQSKVSHVMNEGVLSKWLFELAKGFTSDQPVKLKGESQTLAEHVFIDLEQIKNDTAYELLFIRKEDGSRFFNPRLIRNMKLVTDFGGSLEDLEEDPLRHLSLLQDKIAEHSAKTILKTLGSRLDVFFKEVAKFRSKPLPQLVSSALMSLFMASKPENSMAHLKAKTCIDYLADFEEYLHLAVTSVEYQKMAAYPPKSNNHLAVVLLETIHAIVRAFFIYFDGFKDVAHVIDEMVQQEQPSKKSKAEVEGSLSKRLNIEYENFRKTIKSFVHGPMLRNIEMIENWESRFAPLLQKNWPSQLFSLYMGKKRILCLKLPSPTYQEYIHKAHVLEEFVVFLRASSMPNSANTHLMFNLQDRTSWKEIARCKALEGLSEVDEFKKAFAIATLPFETDFYYQLSPYDQDKHFHLFKQHFIEQLTDTSTGFFFQENMTKIFKSEYLGKLIDAVSHVFFHNKNTLTQEQRLSFISITYLMLYLKCIAETNPDTISFTCKDSLDIGISQSALIFIFFKMLQGIALTHDEISELHHILFSQTLLVRERAMIQERFSRLCGAISVLESIRSEYGIDKFKHLIDEEFSHLIGDEILHSQVVIRN